MYQPKKEKYRRKFRGKMRGVSGKGNKLTVGDYGIKSLGRSWVTSNQLESARKAIVRYVKRKGKLWVRVFPDKAISSKPAEAKMGGGKGDVVGYVAVVKPGRIIFEIGGVKEDVAKEAFRRAGHKLPIKTKFIKR